MTANDYHHEKMLPTGFYTAHHSIHLIPKGQYVSSGSTVKEFKIKCTAESIKPSMSSSQKSISKESGLKVSSSNSSFHSPNAKRIQDLHKPKNFDAAVSKIIAGRAARERLKEEKGQIALRTGDDLARAGAKPVAVTKFKEFNMQTSQRLNAKSVTYRSPVKKSEYDYLPQSQQLASPFSEGSSTLNSISDSGYKTDNSRMNSPLTATKPVEFSFCTQDRVNRRRAVAEAEFIRKQRDEENRSKLKNFVKETLKEAAVQTAVKAGVYSKKSSKEKQDEKFQSYFGQDPTFKSRYNSYYSHYSSTKATSVRFGNDLSGLSFALSNFK